MAMTPKRELFAQELALHGVGIDAYRKVYKAGGNERTVYSEAYRISNIPEVKARIAELRAAAAEAVMIEAKDVVRHWLEIATADPNELVRYRRVNCRFCRGLGHAYQWEEAVYWERCAETIEAKKPLPDMAGGFGFNATLEPIETCPRCHGEGQGDVFVSDTSKLKGAARRLYGGVKMTRNGPEIQMRDQDAAMVNISRWLGMPQASLTVAGPKGGPIPVAGVVAAVIGTDPMEAAKVYQQLMNGG